jgi:uracil-DNA glycosylase
MLFGEAPGPRGADQSGIPFWGDRAGASVYRALEAAGLAQVPPGAYRDWDGARFRDLGLAPVLRGAALSNAFPLCPTRDFQTFRAPTDAELLAGPNQERLVAEERAQWVFGRLQGAPRFSLHLLPHPSAQGLLQAAPGKGKGLKLDDLRQAWGARLASLLED